MVCKKNWGKIKKINGEFNHTRKFKIKHQHLYDKIAWEKKSLHEILESAKQYVFSIFFWIPKWIEEVKKQERQLY